MKIRMSKDVLIERLRAQAVVAQLHDEKVKADHIKAEAKALKEFRAKLRMALGWDYKTLKKSSFEVSIRGPYCPYPSLTQFTGLIKSISMDERKVYVIGPSSDLQRALDWSPHPKSEKDLCGN